MNKYMEKALEISTTGINNKDGGPFGAVIVDSSGNIVGNGNNRVFKNCDPTAHAEIVAIRDACKKLNTNDLTGCTLYTTCEPCPMCLSAIIWSNIKTFYFGCNRKDAANIGFRDDFIYEYLKDTNKHSDIIYSKNIDRDACMEVFNKYVQDGGIIY